MSDTRRKFDQAAATWDDEPRRVRLAEELAAAIRDRVKLSEAMDVLDYGCGSGLVTLSLRPFVHSVTGADTSEGMLAVLQEKVRVRELSAVNTVLLEPASGKGIDGRFHLVVSCMTLHHIEDVASLLGEFHRLLLPGGVLALADLDAEDGSFHGEAMPAAHNGFDRDELRVMLSESGFSEIRDVTAAVVQKPVAGGEARAFPVFLITALR